VLRSNAGLYYENQAEFVETLRAIEQNRWLSGVLGKNGRQFFRQHYDWPVIERKYLDMFERLSKESPSGSMEALPGWLSRRRTECAAGSQVVANLPSGPILTSAVREPVGVRA
jgi:hypothetical protein